MLTIEFRVFFRTQVCLSIKHFMKIFHSIEFLWTKVCHSIEFLTKIFPGKNISLNRVFLGKHCTISSFFLGKYFTKSSFFINIFHSIEFSRKIFNSISLLESVPLNRVSRDKSLSLNLVFSGNKILLCLNYIIFFAWIFSFISLILLVNKILKEKEQLEIFSHFIQLNLIFSHHHSNKFNTKNTANTNYLIQ